MVPLPVHTVEAADEMLPADVGCFAITAIILEYNIGHAPLDTFARYHVLTLIALKVGVAIVTPATSSKPVVAESVEACHWILPIEPVSLRDLLLPAHTFKSVLLFNAAEPARATELIVIAKFVVVSLHVPFVMTARYAVGAVNAPVMQVIAEAPVIFDQVGEVDVKFIDFCH